MAYQTSKSGSGCGCSGGNTPTPRQAPRTSRSNLPLGCGAPVMAEPCPCFDKRPEGCCSTLTLTQGESLSGEMVFCSGRPLGAVACLLPPNQVSFTTPNCLKVDDEFTIWCGAGCSAELTDSVFKVSAISADGLVVTVTPDLPKAIVKTCYTKGLAVLGCPSPVIQTPPYAFLHRDLDNVQFVGAIRSFDNESDSRIDYGVTVTEVPSIISSFENVLSEGDRVCIPSVGIMSPAVVLRVWCGTGYCNGELVSVYYAQLSAAATITGQCGPAHIEHGSLLNFDFELLENGCVSAELSAGQTASIPLRSCDRIELECGSAAYNVGRFEIFAIAPYLNKAGQLRSRTQSIDCGKLVVKPSFSGAYGAC